VAVRQRKSGQGVVEFALALPILVIIIIGVLDFGRAFQTYIRVSNAAREGAFYLASHPDDKDPSNLLVCKANPYTSAINDLLCYPNTKAAINLEINPAGWDTNIANVTVTGCCTRGASVSVMVEQRVTLTGIYFFFGPTPIRNTVKMLVQNAP
jgi:Flp pilus assembly protein TadG